ncbi:hypothetical protein FH581_004165 [Leptospira weilii]|nr:hypothetical protein [Leptospira weilii]EMJ64736.1 hypothetical protein LEP1GSC051_3313 [Leptospira sp. P2653]OMI17698.1 hypothetical protein BUQ74_08515 [Leptospira weilii serovar Heyan]EMN89772.1 hypothetical protein LEP1GSC108_2696 [Leptospira weilii str. UI 13098]ULH30330.1 hypothetical protein FH586_11065 [Leptospira weilii]UPY78072.1 hypothetical protein FH581_004165 [Leptospira weilii]
MHFIPSFLKIQKEKIPQGYGFSLKTFEWVEAFQSSGITTEMVLRYSRENVYIQVSFWIPNDWRNYEWFYIKIGMVPSKLLPSARETMRIKVIPELIQWMNKLLSFPLNSPVRKSSQFIQWDFQGTIVKNTITF